MVATLNTSHLFPNYYQANTAKGAVARRHILDFVRANGPATAAMIQQAVGLNSIRGVRIHIDRLVATGNLVIVKPHKQGRQKDGRYNLPAYYALPPPQ